MLTGDANCTFIRWATASKLDAFFGRNKGMRFVAALNGALDQQYRSSQQQRSVAVSTSADVVASSTAAQRADAFIAGIVNPGTRGGAVAEFGRSARHCA